MGLERVVEHAKVLSNPSGIITFGVVPVVALLEQWPITLPVIGAYGIIAYAVAHRSAKRYSEVSDALEQKGFDGIYLYGETRRLAGIWAERHCRADELREALRLQKLQDDRTDFYGF